MDDLLPSIVERHCRDHPERMAVAMAAAAPVCGLSYGDLATRSTALAHAIAARVAPGGRVLLMLPTGPQFAVAFMACVVARVIAVPLPVPTSAPLLERCRAIAGDCSPDLALIATPRPGAFDAASGLPPTLTVDAAGTAPGSWGPWHAERTTPASVAFLQYTSGSTADPKGVVITHGALAANLAMIRDAFANDATTTGVSWLPLHHDMGLVGHVLEPLWLGITSLLMPPYAFLQQPALWLRAISGQRNVTSGGPTFAYAELVRRTTPEQRQGLDLSGWRVAYCGSEPVRADVLERFCDVFAPHGLRRDAILPCYGLAECTLLAASGRAGSGLRTSTCDPHADQRPGDATGVAGGAIVSCGHAWNDGRVRIVDPDSGQPCADGEVGEIWVSGPHVAAGYWNRPSSIGEVFAVRAADGTGAYLRTGDLGRVTAQGLGVIGRIKEVIIIRGAKHIPQDIEATIQASHPAFRPFAGAAFAVDGDGTGSIPGISPGTGGEQVVVVHEIDQRRIGPGEDWAALEEHARSAVARVHGIVLGALVPVAPGALPRTSSGKIRRGACRTRWAAGALAAIPLPAPPDPPPPSMSPASLHVPRHADPAVKPPLSSPRHLPGAPTP